MLKSHEGHRGLTMKQCAQDSLLKALRQGLMGTVHGGALVSLLLLKLIPELITLEASAHSWLLPLLLGLW
jgi:hypothetical protein